MTEPPGTGSAAPHRPGDTEHSRTCLRAFPNWAMQSRRYRRTLSIPAMKLSRRAALSEVERLGALGRLLTDWRHPCVSESPESSCSSTRSS
ncbi:MULTISPECIES: hypothetical protein [unclassified Streptomyces]|uniref:hypothetical protein n=1 Tax=unclassified Streptomyces TaxID=2593676 RepID=UPI00381E31D1